MDARVVVAVAVGVIVTVPLKNTTCPTLIQRQLFTVEDATLATFATVGV